SNTCVFWNVEDYPIPYDLEPRSVEEKIKSEVKAMNLCGHVSIQFYGKESRFSDDDGLLRKFSDAGIKTGTLPEDDEHAGIYSMLLDMYLWGIENPSPGNVIVLSKNMDDSERYAVSLSDAEPDWMDNLDENFVAKDLTLLFDDGGGSSQAPPDNKRKSDFVDREGSFQRRALA
ncbi:hypothetical protein CARUB_v10006359mg, partial [Capsella rubella]